MDRATCRAEKGFVVSGERRASFGSLAKAAQKQTPPAAVTLKDRKDWKILGKPTRRLDSASKVSGKATFGMDVRVPGMKVAQIEWSPVFGGKVRSFKADKAKAVREATAKPKDANAKPASPEAGGGEVSAEADASASARLRRAKPADAASQPESA